jgi:16S rRNA (cytidine1402-2'-O)-methyltransferase
VIVGTPIGNLGDLSPRAVELLAGADVIACEDTRRTGRLLAHFGIAAPRLMAVHEHNEVGRAAEIVGLVRAGHTVALVSDAGMPAVSDPGERVVAAVVEAGLALEVVPGPAAMVAAVVGSGLPTERFVFEGFLPRKGADRRQRLADIAREPRTVVLYEAPHRLAATLNDLTASMGTDRRVALARELTKLHEEFWRGDLAGAVAHTAEVEPRGEYVVVVEGAPPPEPATDHDIVEAFARHRAAGAGSKQAAAAVAAELGVSQRRAYELGVH